jgi:hypothetical protein
MHIHSADAFNTEASGFFEKPWQLWQPMVVIDDHRFSFLELYDNLTQKVVQNANDAPADDNVLHDYIPNTSPLLITIHQQRLRLL